MRWRDAEPGSVVFTNGVFDLLHVGHIDLLTAARALAEHGRTPPGVDEPDALVVARVRIAQTLFETSRRQYARAPSHIWVGTRRFIAGS